MSLKSAWSNAKLFDVLTMRHKKPELFSHEIKSNKSSLDGQDIIALLRSICSSLYGNENSYSKDFLKFFFLFYGAGLLHLH